MRTAFDSQFYLARYPDVAASGVDPYDHYVRHGAAENRDPSAVFSTSWYLYTYPDVAASGTNPLVHFLEHGIGEGRLGCSPLDRVRSAIDSGQGSPSAYAPASATIGPPAHIALFYTDNAEWLALAPVAEEARRRGYKVDLTNDLELPADIGVYTYHSPVRGSTELAVVMLHDLGQEAWPDNQTADVNHWRLSPWNEFDVGLLPGPSWSKVWREMRAQRSAQPRIGVFEIGWPKADRAFNDTEGFLAEVASLRSRLSLPDRQSVIFALSWASSDKLADFCAALGDLPLNLLVKSAIGGLGRPPNAPPHVRFIEHTTDIMVCLALADVIVSDESSCLGEALLFEIPGVSVTDWTVPAMSDISSPWREINVPGEPPIHPRQGLPARPPAPPLFPIHTTRSGLRSAVQKALRHRVEARAQLQRHRTELFSNLGNGAAAVLDAIDAARSSAPDGDGTSVRGAL